MNLLAIDSSGLVASAAVLNEDKLISEYTVNNGKTHSQTLLPMIEAVVKSAGLTPADIDVIAISKGPGSFTGLRIGSATAKGMGLALGKPLVEVSTLEALAFNMCGAGTLVCPIMDARRNEVYTAVYDFEPAASESTVNGASVGEPDVLVEETAEPLVDLIATLNELGRAVTFVGDGIPVYKSKLSELLKVPYRFAPQSLSAQHASSVGALGLIKALRGEAVPAAEHVPTYLRLSQAEREMAQKN